MELLDTYFEDEGSLKDHRVSHSTEPKINPTAYAAASFQGVNVRASKETVLSYQLQALTGTSTICSVSTFT